MSKTVAKVRKIGNSKGILFTKSMLEKSGIKDKVQIVVKANEIVISPAKDKIKKKWSDFKPVKKEKADFLANRFDYTDWTWQ